MRVTIDPDRCQGHLRCSMLVPELFLVDDMGHSYTEDADVAPERQSKARRAAINCPEQAIEVQE